MPGLSPLPSLGGNRGLGESASAQLPDEGLGGGAHPGSVCAGRRTSPLPRSLIRLFSRRAVSICFSKDSLDLEEDLRQPKSAGALL